MHENSINVLINIHILFINSHSNYAVEKSLFDKLIIHNDKNLLDLGKILRQNKAGVRIALIYNIHIYIYFFMVTLILQLRNLYLTKY